MPIVTRVDHGRRLVISKASGTLQDQDVFRYQRTIFGRPDVPGYDELVDMTEVEKIALPSAARARELAVLSASMDRPHPSAGRPSRFAIVAPDEIAAAIGKMYQAFREMQPGSIKEVAVFRTMAEAKTHLGIDGSIEI